MKTYSRMLLLAAIPLMFLGGCAVDIDRHSDAYLYRHDRYDGIYSRGYVEPVRDRVIIRDGDRDRDRGYAHERW